MTEAKRWLSVLLVCSLLLAQPGSLLEALAATGKAAPAVGQSLAVPAVPDAALSLGGQSLSVPGGVSGAELAAPAALPELVGAAQAPAAAAESAPAAPELAAEAKPLPEAAEARTAPAAQAPEAVSKAPVLASAAALDSKLKAAPAEAGRPLSQAFDQTAAGLGSGPDVLVEGSAGELPGGKLRVFLVRPRQGPVATDLEGLRELVAADPALRRDLEKRGHLRVMIGAQNPAGGIEGKNVDAVIAAVRAAGLDIKKSRTRAETLSIDWNASGGAAASTAKPEEAAQPKKTWRERLGAFLGGARAYFAGNWKRLSITAGAVGLGALAFGVGNPFGLGLLGFLVYSAAPIARETKYCLRQLHAAYLTSEKKPTASEMIGAAFGKFPVVLNNLLANTINYLPALAVPLVAFLSAHAPFVAQHLPKITPGPLHWIGFAIVTIFGLFLDVFHGAYVTTWNNFQKNIAKLRGSKYQNIVGFAYMQLTASVFLTAATFCGLPFATPIWGIAYWQNIIIMAAIGAIIGSLGYQGLNDLYDKGYVSRRQRAFIQQSREFFMLSVGPYLFSGNMAVGWSLYAIQQLIDVGLYAANAFIKTKPLVIVADENVAKTRELALMYPVDPHVVRPSAWQQLKDSINNLRGFILFKPVFLLWDWLAKKLKREKRP